MIDRGEYRSLYVAFADDADVHAMSGDALKLLLMLKLTLPATGIGVVYDSKLCDQVGCDHARLAALYAELAAPKPDSERGWIEHERNVVWIVNALRNEPSLSAANAKKHVPFVRKLVAQLDPRLPIVRRFKAYYAEWFIGETPSIPPANPMAKGTDTLSNEGYPKGNGTVSDRVSKPSLSSTSPSQSSKSEAKGKENPATQAGNGARPASASPLASLDGVRLFLRTFYPKATTTAERRTQIVRELESSLSDTGARLRKEVVRAFTRERLDAKCRAVIAEGVRDPDKAIVVLLTKLADTSDNSAPGQQAELRAPAERALDERAMAEDLEHATAWLADNSDVRETLKADLVNALCEYGMRTVPDEELEPLELANRRIVRTNLLLIRWRAAGSPIAERA